jgi:hypothetical protein
MHNQTSKTMTDQEIKTHKARLRRLADPAKHRAWVKKWRNENRDKWNAMRRRNYAKRKARLAAHA